MQQDHEIAGALVEHAVASLGKPDPQLSQLAFDLRRDRKLWRRLTRATTVQVLLNGIVDLRDRKRPRTQQALKKLIDRLPPPPIPIEHRLRAPRRQRRSRRRLAYR